METELPTSKPIILTPQISNDNATSNHRLWHYFNHRLWHYLFLGATALIFAGLIFVGFNYFHAAFLTKLHDVQLAEEFLAKGFSTSGIEEISPDVAELFAKYEGDLPFPKLTTFNNVPLAKKLLSQKFTFPNIEKISPDVVTVFVSQNFDFFKY